MAQVTRLSPTATPGQLYGSFAGKVALSIVWAEVGGTFTYTAANHPSRSMYFEVDYLATSGTAYADLYDLTGAAEVSGSQLSTASATYTQDRSGALTLADGSVYRARFGSGAGAGGSAWGAKVIALPT